jgi:hypothetical protein
LDLAMKNPSKKLILKVYNTCLALFLLNKANKPDFITHYSKQIIPELKKFYQSEEIYNNWIWGEYLKRIYQINNQEKEARSIANEIIAKNKNDIEIILEKSENDEKNIIYNFIKIGFRHLSMGFCEESLHNYESSIKHFEKIEECYNLIFKLRKNPWDHIQELYEWDLMIKLSQCINSKIQLKMNLKKSNNIKKYLRSFFQLHEIVEFRFFLNFFEGIINEEQYDYYKLLNKYDPDIFNIDNYKNWNLYYYKDENEFFKEIKEERKEYEKPKDMEKAIEDFKLKISGEKWPQKVIDEIMKLYYEKNFDITEWPEEALIGFKILMESNFDLDTIFAEGHNENAIIGTLVGIGKGVIDL